MRVPWTAVSDDLNTFHCTSFYLRLILFGVLAVVLTFCHLNHIRLLLLLLVVNEMQCDDAACMSVELSAVAVGAATSAGTSSVVRATLRSLVVQPADVHADSTYA